VAQRNGAGNTNTSPLPILPLSGVTSAPDTTTTETPGAIIYLTSEGKIFFDSTPVPADQLTDFLKAKKAANQALKLAVRVDRDASPDLLSKVMDAGASAGFGVLPHTFTSGANSLLLPTNSDSAASPPLTNAAPARAPENAPATNSASASINPLSTPPIQDAATRPRSPATNADPYVVAQPAPLTNAVTQPAPLTNSNPDATPPTPEPAKTQ
jgi:hypothetical protein